MHGDYVTFVMFCAGVVIATVAGQMGRVGRVVTTVLLCTAFGMLQGHLVVT